MISSSRSLMASSRTSYLRISCLETTLPPTRSSLPVYLRPERKMATIERGRSKDDAMSPLARQQVARLTPQARQLLRISFREMHKAATNNGLALFVGLFAEYPEYKGIWPQFREIPDSSLFGSNVLRNHATVYMHGLKEIVDAIDDDDRLCAAAKKIASSHLKWNIQKYHIEHMVPELLSVFAKTRGVQLSEAEADAWSTLYDILGNLIDIHKKNK